MVQRAARLGHGAGDGVGLRGKALLELRGGPGLLQYLLARSLVGLPQRRLGRLGDAVGGQHDRFDRLTALQRAQRQRRRAAHGQLLQTGRGLGQRAGLNIDGVDDGHAVVFKNQMYEPGDAQITSAGSSQYGAP